MEDYTNALKDYNIAIDLAPENPFSYYNRAYFYNRIEDYSNFKRLHNRLLNYHLMILIFILKEL